MPVSQLSGAKVYNLLLVAGIAASMLSLGAVAAGLPALGGSSTPTHSAPFATASGNPAERTTLTVPIACKCDQTSSPARADTSAHVFPQGEQFGPAFRPLGHSAVPGTGGDLRLFLAGMAYGDRERLPIRSAAAAPAEAGTSTPAIPHPGPH